MFTTDQWIAIVAIMVTILIAAIAGAYTIIAAFNRRINKMIKARKEEAEKLAVGVAETAKLQANEIQEFREESNTKREELSKEIQLSRHDLRNLIHTEVGELHQRIDQVRSEYMRREDAQELTNAMRHLTIRIDGLVDSLRRTANGK